MGDPDGIRRTMRDSVTEGCLANVMEYMGRAFLLPAGIALGASIPQLSVLTSLPYLLTGIGSEVTASARKFVKDRTRVLFNAASLQATAWLILYLLTYFAAAAADKQTAVLILIGLASFIFLMDAVLQPVWFSLISDIVPAGKRAVWLGRRNQAMFFVALLCLAASGIILDWHGPSQTLYGFSTLFLMAAIARFASAYLLNSHVEPRPEEPKPESEGFLHKEFLTLTFMINFTVYLAAPFFNIYALQTLNFDYLTYSAMLAVQILFAALSYSNWGTVIQKYGSRQVLIANGFLTTLIPALWLYVSSPLHAFAVEAFSGLVWSGLNLAAFGYLFDIAEKGGKIKRFAHRNLAFNSGIFFGTIAGGAALSLLLSSGFGQGDAFKVLFALSAIARLVIFVAAERFVPHLRQAERIGVRALMMRIISVYPIKGLMYDFNSMMHFAKHEAEKPSGVFSTIRRFGKSITLITIAPINVGLEMAEEIEGEIVPFTKKTARLAAELSLGAIRAVNPLKRKKSNRKSSSIVSQKMPK